MLEIEHTSCLAASSKISCHSVQQALFRIYILQGCALENTLEKDK